MSRHKTIEQLIEEMQSFINERYLGINFFYPNEYLEYDSKVHSFGWSFPKGRLFLQDQLDYLKKTHAVENLIPFALNNEDGNEEPYELACFIIDGEGNNRVKTIWPYGFHECLFQKEYDGIRDWFENGIY